jgi:hypothetical protein
MSQLSGFFESWTHREHKLKHLPSLVCWSIWLDKNNFFFENENPSTSSAAYKTLGLFKNWNDVHACKPRLKNTKRTPELEDTSTGWFDGAALSNAT